MIGPPTDSAATEPVIIFFTLVSVTSIMSQVFCRPSTADSKKPFSS